MSTHENEIARGWPSMPYAMQKLSHRTIDDPNPVVRIFYHYEAYARSLSSEQALLFWSGVKPVFALRRAQIEVNMDQIRHELRSETDFYLEPEKITEYYKTLPAESQKPYIRYCIDYCNHADRRVRDEEVRRTTDFEFAGELHPPNYARIRAAYEAELEKLEAPSHSIQADITLPFSNVWTGSIQSLGFLLNDLVKAGYMRRKKLNEIVAADLVIESVKEGKTTLRRITKQQIEKARGNENSGSHHRESAAVEIIERLRAQKK